jgi:hypothetical protein
MTKLHDDGFSLKARERGFRVPGAKLKPRDAHTAAQCDWLRMNQRQMRKQDAIECEVMGYKAHRSAPERKVDRLKRSVSTRAYKRAVALVNGATIHAPNGNCALFVHGAAQQRLINAMLEHVRVQHAIEWDRKTLANAY